MGVGLGAFGSWFGVPMSAFGIAFIGNVWARAMFGAGLLLRGYSKILFGSPLFSSIFPGGDLTAALVPHGFMIGAGLAALVQVGLVIGRRSSHGDAHGDRPARGVGFTLRLGFAGYLCIAMGIGLAGGLVSCPIDLAQLAPNQSDQQVTEN